jgi:hypothetical protein
MLVVRTTMQILTPQRSRQSPACAPTVVYPSFVSRFASLILLAYLMSLQMTAAVTLAELKADAGLTPERLMKHFANFKYVLARETRTPESFLAQAAGDCDDFATLAADLLREKGYSTKLVAVYLPREVHVVCYVAETKCYLDYNCRKQASPLVKCGSDLSAIAARVARSFHAQWRSASEVRVKDGRKRFVSTAFR